MVNRKRRVGQPIQVVCPICQKERTIVCRSATKPYAKLCGHCATAKSHKDNPRVGRAETHYNWKGGGMTAFSALVAKEKNDRK